MNKCFLLFFLVLFNFIIAQERKNVIALEVFGYSQTIISANYERVFDIKNVENLFYSGRVGFGRNPGYEVRGKKFKGVNSLPIVLSAMYGKKHFAKLSIGYTALFSENFVDDSVSPNIVYKKFESDLAVAFGYRFISDGGITLDAFPIAIFKDNPVDKFSISFGVGLGYFF